MKNYENLFVTDYLYKKLINLEEEQTAIWKIFKFVKKGISSYWMTST